MAKGEFEKIMRPFTTGEKNILDCEEAPPPKGSIRIFLSKDFLDSLPWTPIPQLPEVLEEELELKEKQAKLKRLSLGGILRTVVWHRS